MKKPSLIIMAAGLASRFGGNKQLTPIDDQNQMILDYSLYDAWRAGFEQVVFIIQKQMLDQFHNAVGKNAEKHMQINYAFQSLGSYFPSGLTIPSERKKPWGTAHATLCAKEYIHGPFAVINADDFYGRTAFESMYHFLSNKVSPEHYAMIGYRIENTLSKSGSVSRGVCEIDSHGYLTDIQERTEIYPADNGAKFTEDHGNHFTFLPDGTMVSMNLWGFDETFIDKIHDHFEPWLKQNLPINPEKCEYYLPYLPHIMIKEENLKVSVLPTNEKWYGITYKNDLEDVCAAVLRMKADELYPARLW